MRAIIEIVFFSAMAIVFFQQICHCFEDWCFLGAGILFLIGVLLSVGYNISIKEDKKEL